MADEREIAHIPNGVTTHNIFKVAIKLGFSSHFTNYFPKILSLAKNSQTIILLYNRHSITKSQSK